MSPPERGIDENAQTNRAATERSSCYWFNSSASLLLFAFFLCSADGALNFPDILLDHTFCLQAPVTSNAAGFLFDFALDLAGRALHLVLSRCFHILLLVKPT
jgi:hypothetical protein